PRKPSWRHVPCGARSSKKRKPNPIGRGKDAHTRAAWRARLAADAAAALRSSIEVGVRGASRTAPYGVAFGALSAALAAWAQLDRMSVLLVGAASFGSIALLGAVSRLRAARKT